PSHAVARLEREVAATVLSVPESAPGEPEQADGRVLRGIAASGGIATGRARVARTPEEGAALQPGEVLIAPFTDPGWTPLFAVAAAVVTDLGGVLSHGAIVAREYGIPAVVNTRHATTRIRTGQIVTVDGDAGTVQVAE
ncbi:MAG: pyruvate, water dikinase, partial [Chloroflexota bacterium]